MSKAILIQETQKLRQWWILPIVAAVNLLFIYGIYKQVILGEPFGNKPISNLALIISALIMLILSVLVYQIKLQTEIREDGIYVKFFPFHFRFQKFEWNALSKCYVREYNPIAEYGGWGLRMGFFGKGKAFNLYGNKGLQLVFTNDQKLLIGTNKPEELSNALNQLGKLQD